MSAPAAPSPPVEMPAGGAVVTGPSAFSGSPRRFGALTRTLAVQQFKLRFFGSVLGYAWQLMRPLMLFGVLYVVFSQVVRIGEEVPYYPVVLLTGIVLFTFLSEATIASVSSVVDNENLVRKIHFPRLVIPLSVTLTAAFNLGMNLVVVAIFAAISGVEPGWSALLAIPLVAALALLAAGLAMLLSALYVRYRDMKPIWEVVLQVLFYVSPILYTIETVSDRYPKLSEFLLWNPFAAILQAVRHVAIDPSAPSAAEAIGGAPRLLIPTAILVAIVVIGVWVFNREAPRIAEDL